MEDNKLKLEVIPEIDKQKAKEEFNRLRALLQNATKDTYSVAEVKRTYKQNLKEYDDTDKELEETEKKLSTSKEDRQIEDLKALEKSFQNALDKSEPKKRTFFTKFMYAWSLFFNRALTTTVGITLGNIISKVTMTFWDKLKQTIMSVPKEIFNRQRETIKLKNLGVKQKDIDKIIQAAKDNDGKGGLTTGDILKEINDMGKYLYGKNRQELLPDITQKALAFATTTGQELSQVLDAIQNFFETKSAGSLQQIGAGGQYLTDTTFDVSQLVGILYKELDKKLPADYSKTLEATLEQQQASALNNSVNKLTENGELEKATKKAAETVESINKKTNDILNEILAFLMAQINSKSPRQIIQDIDKKDNERRNNIINNPNSTKSEKATAKIALELGQRTSPNGPPIYQ